MNKSELMENYTMEQLADMVVKLDTATKVSSKHIYELENKTINLKEENGRLQAKIDTYNNYLLTKCTDKARKLIDHNHFTGVVIVSGDELKKRDCGKEDEINNLKDKLQRKETIINQIDDILNELFGVTHDVAKPDELKGVLKEKIESIKSVEQITTIINGIPKTYKIDEIGEIVKLYEDIKYCNEHRGEHLHSEEYLKIMSLNNEIARLRELVDKYKNAFEKTKKERDCQICEYQNEINKLASKTIADFLPIEPIKVVDTLISASKKSINCMTEKEYDKYIFEKWQLRQIAEHLLVYCNANGEGEE